MSWGHRLLPHRPCLGWRAVLGAAGMSAALWCVPPAWSQNNSASLAHEKQLQAIRQALLEATLETPTQVLSSAWVDAQGTLHESHEFNSRAEVRGVRVLSYLNDGEEPKARVSAEVLPWNWRQRDGSASLRCESAPQAWRLPMTLTARLDSGFSGEQMAAAQSLLGSAQRGWRQLLQQTGRWTPSDWQAPAGNAYQRALLGATSEDPRHWIASLSLRPVPGEDRPWYAPLTPWDTAPEWRWTLELQVAQRQAAGGGFRVVAREAMLITVDPQALARHPQQWQQALQPELLEGMVRWMQKFDTQTRCEPLQFMVRRQEGQTAMRLLAGASSGLRAGDRVLLMQPGWVPSRMLDPRSVEHLVLAEVVQAGVRQTEIRQLAGPPLARQGEWIAIPL